MPALPCPLIAPSILSADFSRMGEEIRALEQSGADWIHLDVMDGHFVPNLTFGAPMIKALRPHSRLVFDVHLMVAPADSFIEMVAQAGADQVSFHIEAGPHTHRSLQRIKAFGLKAGIAICPATPMAALSEVLDMIDHMLVMTVNPGFGGQDFLPSQLTKIRKLRAIADNSGRDIRIIVDGGITAKTAPLVLKAGADVLVAGSYIFSQSDYAVAIRKLRRSSFS